jgi:hypothetical protein
MHPLHVAMLDFVMTRELRRKGDTENIYLYLCKQHPDEGYKPDPNARALALDSLENTTVMHLRRCFLRNINKDGNGFDFRADVLGLRKKANSNFFGLDSFVAQDCFKYKRG